MVHNVEYIVIINNVKMNVKKNAYIIQKMKDN